LPLGLVSTPLRWTWRPAAVAANNNPTEERENPAFFTTQTPSQYLFSINEVVKGSLLSNLGCQSRIKSYFRSQWNSYRRPRQDDERLFRETLDHVAVSVCCHGWIDQFPALGFLQISDSNIY
jgi:hypothetical protein